MAKLRKIWMLDADGDGKPDTPPQPTLVSASKVELVSEIKDVQWVAPTGGSSFCGIHNRRKKRALVSVLWTKPQGLTHDITYRVDAGQTHYVLAFGTKGLIYRAD